MNVKDIETRNEFRRLIRSMEELRGQIAVFIKTNTVLVNHSALQGLDYASSGHTGFAASGDVASGTSLVHSGASAPTNGALLWMDTDGGPFGNGSLKIDWGSGFVETGIVAGP